jgi:hypothetical protein
MHVTLKYFIQIKSAHPLDEDIPIRKLTPQLGNGKRD